MLAKTPARDRFLAFCDMQGAASYRWSSCSACALARFGQWESGDPLAKFAVGGGGFGYRTSTGRYVYVIGPAESSVLAGASNYADAAAALRGWRGSNTEYRWTVADMVALA